MIFSDELSIKGNAGIPDSSDLSDESHARLLEVIKKSVFLAAFDDLVSADNAFERKKAEWSSAATKKMDVAKSSLQQKKAQLAATLDGMSRFCASSQNREISQYDGVLNGIAALKGADVATIKMCRELSASIREDAEWLKETRPRVMPETSKGNGCGIAATILLSFIVVSVVIFYPSDYFLSLYKWSPQSIFWLAIGIPFGGLLINSTFSKQGRLNRRYSVVSGRLDTNKISIELLLSGLISGTKLLIPEDLREADRDYNSVVAACELRLRDQITKSERYYSAAITGIRARLQERLSATRALLTKIQGAAEFDTIEWNDPKWSGWRPPQGLPTAYCLGKEMSPTAPEKLGVAFSDLDFSFILPTLSPFPSGPALLINTDAPGRTQALKGIQAILSRLLATTAPGRLLCTFFDPIGLGQSVAPFLHLADYEEALVTSRAWSEPEHIERRLKDLKFPAFNYATSFITAAISGFCVGLPGSAQAIPKPSPPRSWASRRRRSAKAYSVRLVAA